MANGHRNLAGHSWFFLFNGNPVDFCYGADVRNSTFFVSDIPCLFYVVGIIAGTVALMGSLMRMKRRDKGSLRWILGTAGLSWLPMPWARYILSMMNQLPTGSSAFLGLHSESIVFNAIVGMPLIGGLVIEPWT